MQRRAADGGVVLGGVQPAEGDEVDDHAHRGDRQGGQGQHPFRRAQPAVGFYENPDHERHQREPVDEGSEHLKAVVPVGELVIVGSL